MSETWVEQRVGLYWFLPSHIGIWRGGVEIELCE